MSKRQSFFTVKGKNGISNFIEICTFLIFGIGKEGFAKFFYHFFDIIIQITLFT